MDIRVLPAESEELLHRAFVLRHAVFVVEENVPEALERDAADADAFHVVALLGARCIGTGRLVRQPGGAGRIGRMAIDGNFRRRGVGALVLRALEERARAEGLRELELHAQCYVERFYARNGYQREGGVFAEAGIDHVLMRKAL